jgi:hypothetical protein
MRPRDEFHGADGDRALSWGDVVHAIAISAVACAVGLWIAVALAWLVLT